MEKEDEQKPGREQPEGEVKCDKEQYERLLRCSKKKDITEWNHWRKKHPHEEIRLQEAEFIDAHLENADLASTHLENANLADAHLEHANLEGAHLENANLALAHLENANLMNANLENADLIEANLENTILYNAHLENADLVNAHLENANLCVAHLKNAGLGGAHLENAALSHADLENAIFWNAYLGGASFDGAKLQGADFSRAIVDGETLFYEDCEVDCDTKFEAVALGNLRMYPNLKQLLEYNVRRKNWEVWYPKKKWWLRFITRKFWEMSDYGISTKQVILTFFKWAIVFAVIYYMMGAVDYYLVGVKDYPGPIADLFVDEGGTISWYLVPLRSIYFSVVTMTTLGFGDMHANPHNPWWGGIGHLLLMLQVLLGYVLLGALVTRFAVLFTAGGPAGKFSPIKEKETAEGEKKRGEQ